MGRVPFYAYPNSPYSFYPSPAEAYFHRQHPPFAPASSSAPRPSPSSRSVISVPVYDSAPSQRSPSPAPQRPQSLVDPSLAATKIQSHFRGFCVRRHHPLIHLRAIARARKQLEDLQSELETPEFSLNVRASEKERLRFSESVMAIILRLDAIEGSMSEVRSQRKEVTKMAIKLQDAIDAIMMQKDEIAALDLTDDKGLAPSDDAILTEQPPEALLPEVMVQGESCAVSANAKVDVNTQEKDVSPEDNAAGTCMPNVDSNNVMDMEAAEDISLLHPCEAEDLAGKEDVGSGNIESVSQVQHAEGMCEAEQNMGVATYPAEVEVGNGNDALHVENHGNYMQNHILDINVVQDIPVEAGADDSSAKKECNEGIYRCMDGVQEGINQAIESGPSAPTADKKCDYLNHGDVAHENGCRGLLTSLERLTDGNCSLDSHSTPELSEHGNEECSDVAHDANSIDMEKAQACTLSMIETPFAPPNNAILHQLSEDCRQLKSLVGKLLVQNKAQSNIMCVLAERLELLERQQQHNCRRKQLKTQEKRRLKKGMKRNGKHHNCEEC